MADLLVKLYTLPPLEPALAALGAGGVLVRRALPSERRAVAGWVAEQFSEAWASECETAFSRQPVAVFLAVALLPGDTNQPDAYAMPRERLLGFACYEATCKNFFGPTGVGEQYRGRGIGTGLLLACLHALAAEGYAYAIIGWAGPAEFYRQAVGATVIEGSEPGIFRGRLV